MPATTSAWIAFAPETFLERKIRRGTSGFDAVASGHADGYNFPGAKWRAFGTIFADAYAFSVARGLPFFIAETASPANDPRTPSWISG